VKDYNTNRGLMKFRLKTIDYYIIKKFIGTFIFSIALIVCIAVVFDFSEKVDDFLDRDAPWKAIVFDYYMNFIPYFIYLFAYLFTFISVIFFTSRMAVNSEIIAIFSSGMSFRRLMLPYFIGALIIFIISFLLGSYIIPRSSAVKLDFEEKYYKNPYRYSEENIHKQIEPGIYIYLNRYFNNSDTGTKFSVEKFEDGELVSKLMAASIRWDKDKSKWVLSNYYIHHFDGLDERIESGREIDTTLNFFPEEFHRRVNIVETMTSPELSKFIETERIRGADNIKAYLIEKHRRYSSPFAVFILTLIGVSLSARKVKGGIGLQIGLGLLLSFSYILFMRVTKVFSVSGDLDPLIAVWIPNIIYAGIAVILYRLAPK